MWGIVAGGLVPGKPTCSAQGKSGLDTFRGMDVLYSSKVFSKRVMPTVKWDNSVTEDLFRAILALRNLREAKRFFRDLLTEKEILDFANRWEAAQMLDKRVSYAHIEEVTGLSSTTIARISKWLYHGMDGYRLMLKRLHHHHHAATSPGGKRMC